MLSTMQDVPLTVTRILEHGALVHGSSQITTWTGEGEPQRRSFRAAASVRPSSRAPCATTSG